MADTRWTPAQTAAIHDRGGALLVSAAAGSGKTAVLTERAVGLITDPDCPVDADKLLIVTFTNAAAAELRARIGQRLTEEVKKDPANVRLRRQKMLLQRANICTVDAFCLDLLRRHFSQLDIPADFQTGDTGTLQALRDAALAETMEEMVANPDYCAFADLYGRGRSDAAAGQAILQLHQFLQALPDPDQCLEVYLEPWRTPNGFVTGGTAASILAEVRWECFEIAGGLSRALSMCRRDEARAVVQEQEKKKTPAAKQKAEEKVREKYAWFLDRLEQAEALFRQLEELAAAEDWDGVYQMLEPYRTGQEPLPGFKGSRKRLSGFYKSDVKAVADQAGEMCAKIAARIPADTATIEQDRQIARPMLEALAAAQRDFSARYYAKKLEKKVLEFSDFEHLTLKLLRTPAQIRDEAGKLLPTAQAFARMQNPDGCRTPLCEQLRSEFAAVMVDEYQDTNALQDTIYNCLAAKDGSNLFFVGDIKQSIYRFRQADPDIFLERERHYTQLPGGAARRAAGGDVRPAKLALDANFRSAPAVVDGVNYIFERSMTPKLGGVVYGDGQRLVCGVPGSYPGRVEAIVLDTGELEQQDAEAVERIRAQVGDETPVRKRSAAEKEADWIAMRIKQLVEKEKAEVRDKGGLRPIRYEDCCILVATRSNFSAYTEALTAWGIPSYADAAEDLLSAAQVRPLIALLRVMDNPARNIELAAVMNSALFGFTDDDLLRLRAYKRRCSLYGALVAVAQSEDTDLFAEKCRAFYQKLDTLRRMARSMPMDRLFEEIFAHTGYLAAVGAGAEGLRRRDEVRRFAAWAAEAGASGLGGLVRAIEATQAAGGLTDSASGKSKPGCVSVMTIHRSKGLQFPAVFVADTERGFNMEDTRRPVLLHRESGIGLMLRGPGGLYSTAQRMDIRRKIEDETRSEKMRLLYVALTRAQDMLFVTIPLNKPQAAIDEAAQLLRAGMGDWGRMHASNFAEWLLMALLLHPGGGVLRREAAEADEENNLWSFVERSASPMEIALWDGGAGVQLSESLRKLVQGFDPPAEPKVVQKLAENFAWRYPAQIETAVPAKVSVTSLAHRQAVPVLERPGFLSAEGLTAAERGTALHAFLEHANFGVLAQAQQNGAQALAQAVEAERQRQLQLRLTTPDADKALDTEKLLAFLQSEAFAKVCAAQQVYKEYDFITAVPARQLPDAPDSDAPVMVQGIADLLLVYPDHLELLDYKTDRNKTADQLRQAYHLQLEMYARALEQRFAPRKVTYKGIYAFGLDALVEV